MRDYIKREDALGCVTYDEEYTTEQIKGLPSADVAPVVHGEWIRSGADGHIICNKCRYETKYTIVERQDATGKWISRFAQDMKTNFCPNCGAKMDGERKE